MKRLYASLVPMMALLLTTALGIAGQPTDGLLLVEVPFDFVAGDRQLPAGTYRVEVLPEDEQEPALITLQTAAAGEGDELIFHSLSTRKVELNDTSWTEDPRLVFSKVGDLYFLEAVEVR